MTEFHGSSVRFLTRDLDSFKAFDNEDEIPFIGHTLDGPEEEAVAYVRKSPDVESALSVRYSQKASLLIDRAKNSNLGANRTQSETIVLYDPIVKGVSLNQLPSGETITRLGASMIYSKKDASTSRIPAAFTYLGQFIAHDMSFMGPLQTESRPQNYRTHALRLDSLFQKSETSEELDKCSSKCLEGLCLGLTDGEFPRFSDLYRAETGIPCISDRRNENNLGIGQLTVALIKFFHRICELCGNVSYEEKKLIFRRHMHSIILSDYLKQTCDDTIYKEVVCKNRRRLIFPETSPRHFLISSEFAGACFRFGHSQIRQTYNLNSRMRSISASQLLHFSHIGAIRSKNPILPDNWVIDWKFLYPSSSNPSDNGYGSAIDTKLESSFKNLDRSWFYDSALPNNTTFNLATITLLRGQGLRLPTAQKLQNHLRTIGTFSNNAAELHALGEKELFSGSASSVGNQLTQDQREEIIDKTPLWYYTLCELNGKNLAGKCLGPLGSRVVCETIHAAIQATDDNIIDDSNFSVLPGLPEAGADSFSLSNLIESIS